MGIKTTSIKVDDDFWREVKKHCIDLKIDISDYVKESLKKNMKITK